MHSVLNVIEGDRFGRLLVLETSGSGYNKNASISKCRCDCGNEITIKTIRLWRLRSCGCYLKEKRHYKSHSKLWRAWQAMKARCYRKSNKRYPEWGGRGIVVCVAIKSSFQYFQELIGEPPSQKHSIDRSDNSLNYSCGKCDECIKNGWGMNIRWATSTEQSQNKSDNRNYVFKGEILCLSEISKRVNLPFKTVYARIANGWDFNDAISVPVRAVTRHKQKV